MGEPMRALSVRQPWAWAICHGKDVENRSRGTRHRGLLAIHASKSAPFKADLDDLRIADLIVVNGFRLDDPPSAQGTVVAVAELTGCHRADECMRPAVSLPPGCSPWAASGQWHWQLASVSPLPDPVPCRGALGLWRLPDDVEKLVREQLEATDGHS